MAIKKPAKSAMDYLRRCRDARLDDYIQVLDLLRSLDLNTRYWFINDILKRAVWRKFRRDILEAEKYWGKSEIEGALNTLEAIHEHSLCSVGQEMSARERRSAQKTA